VSRIRLPTLLSFALLALLQNCGPDTRQRDLCNEPHPDFVVVITPVGATLPADTRVRVLFGSSLIEDYHLNQSNNSEVVFCHASSLDGGPLDTTEAGAGSDAGQADAAPDAAGVDSPPVEALRCELWTDGGATIEISSASEPTVRRVLTPLADQCTVSEVIDLDQSDAGP
jgi:hypothetical protein